MDCNRKLILNSIKNADLLDKHLKNLSNLSLYRVFLKRKLERINEKKIRSRCISEKKFP